MNDVFGHTTGDQVLRAIGRLLDNRPSPNESPQIWRASDGAVAFAERLRQHIMGLKRLSELDDLAALSFPLSCSIGVATFPTNATTSHELIQAADMAMYAAKQAGKNCVKVFGHEIGVPEFLHAR